MDVSRIVEALKEWPETGGVPVEIFRAAGTHRAELVPVFLREIEACAAAGAAEPPHPYLVFHAFHLLGEWGEARAYRPFAALLRCQPASLDMLLGDAISLTIHRVMVQVFDGDFEPLRGIILDPHADEFVRCMMFEAVLVLSAQGKLNPADVQAFLVECFDRMQPRDACLAWSGWVDAVAKLGLADLRPQVMEAFKRGWLEGDHITPSSFETLMAAHILAGPRVCILDSFKPLVDTRAELLPWRPKAFGVPGIPLDLDEAPYSLNRGSGAGTDAKPSPAPGRNDPCPCGSGKKYKKCCLLVLSTPSTTMN